MRNAQGAYEVFDAAARPLNHTADLYESVLWTLAQVPQRTPPYAVGEGERFRQWVIKHNQAPAERRLALAEPPVRMQPAAETEVLLGGGACCKMSRTDSDNTRPKTIAERIKLLLPNMSEDGVRRLSSTLGTLEGEQTLAQMESQNSSYSSSSMPTSRARPTGNRHCWSRKYANVDPKSQYASTKAGATA